MKRTLLVIGCLFFLQISEAKPRHAFPKTPDEIGQNDRDLDDQIRNGLADVAISSITLPVGSTNYIQNTNTLQAGSSYYVHHGSATRMDAGILVVNQGNTPGFNLSVTLNGSGTAGINLGAAADLGQITTNGAATALGMSINGGSEFFHATIAGEVTKPLQPCFLATNSAAATDVTGDGTRYQVTWDTEIFDQSADFTSSTFTAPVSGRYFFSALILPQNFLVTHNDRNFNITTSNRVYNMNRNYLLAETNNTMTVSTFADMDANDTAYITVTISGSTKSIDIIGNTTLNFFSGSLIN